ncbi:PAS domain S-box protein [Deinococcus aquaedulcis]|uniref:PAS domain S-box protein n=1 Tax=Deinococcus aquaedulcis TaxID=2840455 RepID=UPI001C82DE98|nr:PAS domain S-box protein [Deinococcus aquaedulcis]
MPLTPAAAPFDVLVLIACAGQAEAARRVLAGLTQAQPVAVLIACPAGAAQAGAALEAWRPLSPLPLRVAEHGTVLAPGAVYLAPPHDILEVQPGLRCALTPQEAQAPRRPLDQLLGSLALSAGARALVAILNGAGDDGVAGTRALRGVGGTVLVQRLEGAALTDQPLAQAATLTLSPSTLGQVVADLLASGTSTPAEATADVRASEEKYRALFTQMDEAYAVVEVMKDDTGRWTDFLFLEVNPAFMPHTGMPYPVGRTGAQLLGTPNPRWAELYGQVAETGVALRVEEGELTLGRVFDLNIFRLGGQGSRQVAVLFTDITERKRREATRELLVELSRDLSQPASEEALLHTVGAKLVAHLGLTCYHYVDVDEDRAEVTIRHFWHALAVPPVLGTYPIAGFMAPEGLRRLRAGASSVISDVQSELPGDSAATAALKAGADAQRIGAYVAVPYSQDGRWKAYFTVAHSEARPWTEGEIDLIQEVAARLFPRIERVRAEEALRASEARYRSLAETVPAIVWESSDEAVDYFNPRWFTYTGLDPAAGLGDAWHRVVHPDDAAEAVRRSAEAASTGAVYEMDYRLRRADGEYRRHLARAVRDPATGRWTGTAVDIHDLSEAQAALQASETRFRQFAEHSGDVLWVWNAAGQRVEYVSPAVALVWGMTPEQVMADVGVLYAVVHPEDRDWATAAMPRVLAGETVAQEYRIVRPDTGEVRWLHDTAFPIRDASGHVHRVGGIAQDVTEQKAAEAALRESEERQAFLLRLSDALRPLTEAGAIENTAARVLGEHLGATRVMYADIEGEPGAEVGTLRGQYHAPGAPAAAPFPARYRYDTYGERVMALRRSGETMVVTDVTTDARFGPAERAAWAGGGVHAAVTVPLVRGGRFVADFGVQSDKPRDWSATEVALVEATAERTWAAVERARAEHALRVSEEKYRTLFDTMAEGFTVCKVERDAAGQVADLRYLEVNRGLERQTGLDRQTLLGRRLSEVLPDADLQRWMAVYTAVINSGEPATFEEYTELLDRWFAVSVYPRPGDELIVFSHDVTERRRAEDALRANEERQAFLLRLSDTLRPLADPTEIIGVATRLLGEGLRASRAYYAEWPPGTDRVEIRRDYAAPGLPSLVGHYPIEFFRSINERFREGQTWIVEDAADGTIPAAERDYCLAHGVAAWVDVPLLKGGELQAALFLIQDTPRRWNAAEIALVEETAERTWAAVERAQAEEARHASESRFRAVANLVPDLLWESQPDGATTWHNQRWLDYTGQTLAQATGWGWTEAIHPEDRGGSLERYRQAAQSGQPLRHEHRIRRHDGAYRWFVVNAFALRDDHGAVVRVYGAATDIHHLRVKSAVLEARVEERTRQLSELNTELASRTRALEAFADLTRSLSAHLDPYALIQRGQEVALSLLPGASATYAEPEGRWWRLRSQVGDLRNPELQAALLAGLERGRTPSLDQPWDSGEPLFQGQDILGTDGPGAVDHATPATATLPLLVGGRPLGVFAVTLHQQRAWSGADRAVLKTVVRNLGLALERAEAVRALAEERDALGTFAHFAEQAAEIQEVPTLAQHATEVLQQVLAPDCAAYLEREGEVWRLHHPSGPLTPELEVALRQGVPADLPEYAVPGERQEPVFFEHGDAGEPPSGRPAAIAAYPLFPQDHPAGMLSMVARDRPSWTVREKAVFRAVGDSFRLALERTAQLQQIKRQRERLADLNAELGTLITRTAHNLEAPAQKLGPLLGPGPSAETPLDGLSPYDPALLRDEITRLKGVAEDLRQLARLEVHPLARELLPLGELLAAVREGLSLPPGRQVDWQVAPLPIVRGDRALLGQALTVLMDFTLSATRGARYVTVSSHEVEGEVHVTVEDDGVGLTAEEAATLFDLAVRTDQSVPILEGSGLLQVRRIMARHGGWAWAEVRRGGAVVLAFPRDEAVTALETLFRDEWPGG